MLLKDFISSARKSLVPLYPEEEAKAIVSRLCEEMLHVPAYAHVLEPAMEVPENRLRELQDAGRRLAAGEPLQYVLGYAYFCGRQFRVTPDVLIPRPETEQLCGILIEAVPARPGFEIIDLCTGSGCIAWTLACAFPGARISGVDISSEALSVASSQDIGVPEGCRKPDFFQYDVLRGPDGICPESGQYDIVVSNPPYVRESEKALMHANVLDNEPGLALFVDDADPLVFYRAILDISRKRLRPGGMGFLEINEAFGTQIVSMFSGAGFAGVRVLKDFRDRERFVVFAKA